MFKKISTYIINSISIVLFLKCLIRSRKKKKIVKRYRKYITICRGLRKGGGRNKDLDKVSRQYYVLKVTIKERTCISHNP